MKGNLSMLKAICSSKELTGSRYYDCVYDIIFCPQLGKLKDITHHICTTRFQHCVNVSYHSYLICRKLHLNARSAARAGLMHDLFYYDRKEYNSGKDKNQPSHSAMHSQLALRNASSLTHITDLERDMIENHMWPLTHHMPRYAETYIITLVDKYCAVLEFLLPRFTAAKSNVK